MTPNVLPFLFNMGSRKSTHFRQVFTIPARVSEPRDLAAQLGISGEGGGHLLGRALHKLEIAATPAIAAGAERTNPLTALQ